MNKEKTRKLARDFFAEVRKIGESDTEYRRNLDDADDVLKFYQSLNDSQESLGHEWYIEEVMPLGNYSDGGSFVCTLWVGGLFNTVILDWNVNVSFENIEDLYFQIENLEDKAQQAKSLLAKYNYNK